MLIPIKQVPFFLSSYSSLLCKTLSGFVLDCSAKPNSSNKIIHIGTCLSLLSFITLFDFSLSFLHTLYNSSDFLNNSSTSSGSVFF